MLKILLILTTFVVTTTLHSQNKKRGYTSGHELVKAMHSHYAPGKWYRYFTFSQKVEYYRNDSIVKNEVWHEAYRPGALIIKVGSKNAKTGRVYTDFTSYSFTEGQEPKHNPRVHELLLVGLDVYFFKPQQTLQLLDSLGYNLSLIREDEFEGRKVFVVGAKKGDLKSRQFWIDAERLYMHRVIYEQKGKTNDVVFGDYTRMGDYWIAKTIYFKADEKLYLIERYYDIKFPKSISDDWFDPARFNEVVLD